MNKALIDTDIFSEMLKAKNINVVQKAKEYQDIFGKFTISTITVLEIVKGFHKMQFEQRIQVFMESISSVEVLSLNLESAETAGRIYADLERTGQTIGRADPIISAIALESGLVLVTGNVEHYQRILFFC
ncbi:PIN domain-containing protein [Desulfonema limicola]|uniref:PIN domain-containing protein n=1 Tax=Desulfonema limicola TaxID=45656 RepID=A0A975BEH0_9BACT|nr:PIN domain-containing protein [Desulfonema limicola]QTA83620.1 PIN domain-containing protein [Desulfonema limicola]